jgi:hypothetical protein
LSDVTPGTWLLGVVDIGFGGVVPQVYRGVDCPAANVTSFAPCDLARATPVLAVGGSENSAINFDLRRSGARGFRVVGPLSTPLQGVALDLWDAQGRRVDSRSTNDAGIAWLYPSQFSGNPTPFRVSTDNAPAGFPNQVYNGIQCPAGSVFFGLCPLIGATELIWPAATITPTLQIAFGREAELFASSFEP